MEKKQHEDEKEKTFLSAILCAFALTLADTHSFLPRLMLSFYVNLLFRIVVPRFIYQDFFYMWAYSGKNSDEATEKSRERESSFVGSICEFVHEMKLHLGNTSSDSLRFRRYSAHFHFSHSETLPLQTESRRYNNSSKIARSLFTTKIVYVTIHCDVLTFFFLFCFGLAWLHFRLQSLTSSCLWIDIITQLLSSHNILRRFLFSSHFSIFHFVFHKYSIFSVSFFSLFARVKLPI